MKPNKQKIVNDILLHLEEGKGFNETFELLRTKTDIGKTSFSEYWKVANEDFLKTLSERKQAIEDKSTQAFIESVEEGLMNKYDKLKILENIINCKTKFKKVFVSNGEQVILDIESDVTAVLKAIELHNRMQGDYKPDFSNVLIGVDYENAKEIYI
jgi:hypothetical protein